MPSVRALLVRARGGDQLEAGSPSTRAMGTISGLSALLTEMKTLPAAGSAAPAAIWLLAKARGKSASMPMTSPVLAHLRAEDDVHAGELAEGEDDFLDGDVGGSGGSVMPSSASDFPAMTLAAILAQGTPVALPTKGTVRERGG